MQVRYVPKPMGTLHIPGGQFAVFPVEMPEAPMNSTVLCENVQVTWYFALKQWLPDSDWLPDESRVSYEYYLDGEAWVCIPVVPKIPPQEPRKRRKRNADETTE